MWPEVSNLGDNTLNKRFLLSIILLLAILAISGCCCCRGMDRGIYSPGMATASPVVTAYPTMLANATVQPVVTPVATIIATIQPTRAAGPTLTVTVRPR